MKRTDTITAVMVLDRWPQTLPSLLAALDPFVSTKVAVVDQSNGFAPLDGAQCRLFDAVRYTKNQTLDQLRNESLQLARQAAGSSWALVLDSDEHIDAQELMALCQAIASYPKASAFLLPRFNYVGRGRWATTYSFRLFRLDEPISYSYQIHESISPSLVRNGLSWQYVGAAIQHLDFIDPVAGKRARYKALLAEAIRKGEDLAFLNTLYAIECIWSGEHASALQLLDEAIEFAGDRNRNQRFNGRDDFPVAAKAQLFLHCGEFSRAKPLLERLCGNAEPRVAAEGWLGLALIEAAQGDHARALELIEASLARWQTAEAVFSSAIAHCELNEQSLALRDLSCGLRLNSMAADPRIQGEIHRENIFALQCLLHPGYQGFPHLLRKLMR